MTARRNPHALLADSGLRDIARVFAVPMFAGRLCGAVDQMSDATRPPLRDHLRSTWERFNGLGRGLVNPLMLPY